MDVKMDKIWFVFLIAFGATVNSQPQISDPPADVTARVGDNATIICRVNGEPDDLYTLEWREYVTSSTGKLIYKHNYGVLDDFKDMYEVIGSGGNYDLKIKYTKISQGGFYGCSISVVNDAPLRGDLVLLDKPDISHTDLIEGHYNLLRCYGSYGAPVETEIAAQQRAKLRMFIEYNNGPELLEGNFTEIVKGVPGPEEEYTPWQLQLDVNRTFIGSDNGVNVTCEIYTEQPQLNNEASTELDVLFAVRNLEIAPRNSYYYVGEYINCTVEGNPEPDISWEAIYSAGARPVEGGYLEISYLMEGQNTWKCTAINSVENTEVIAEEISFEVLPPPPEGSMSLKASHTVLWTSLLLFMIKTLNDM